MMTTISPYSCRRRPSRVCLCPSLPAAPLETQGLLVVIQHPYEAKWAGPASLHARHCCQDDSLQHCGSVSPAGPPPAPCRRPLATVPLLQLCLQRFLLLRGRYLRPGRFPVFDQLLADVKKWHCPVYVLWPSKGALVGAPLCPATWPPGSQRQATSTRGGM